MSGLRRAAIEKRSVSQRLKPSYELELRQEKDITRKEAQTGVDVDRGGARGDARLVPLSLWSRQSRFVIVLVLPAKPLQTCSRLHPKEMP